MRRVWAAGAIGVAIWTIAGTAVAAPRHTAIEPAVTGCRSVSAVYPWGRFPIRRWTPIASAMPARAGDAPGTAFGPPFEARLIQAHGIDTPIAKRVVELELADGCRRRFRASSLSPADAAMIAAEIDRRPSIPDPAHYALNFQPGRGTQAMLDAGTVEKIETQHFALWYGKRREGASYRYVAERGLEWTTFVEQAGAWLERIWQIDHDLLKAPMPFAKGTDRKKVNVNICGTGLPFAPTDDLASCGSGASSFATLNARDIQYGSVVSPHEFGHVIEFETGGFRDKPEVWPIWETAAEWNAFEISPTFGAQLQMYLNNLENGPLWSSARYGAFPFYGFLYHQDRTRPFIWRSWTNNKRTQSGGSTEDFLQTFVRLGQEAGVYPGGFASFADDIGWYGARLAAMDFIDQRTLLDMIYAPPTGRLFSQFHTMLTDGGAKGAYLSPDARPLRQFGTHIVPLTATGKTVEVTLTGATAQNLAEWRFAIVAVGNGSSNITYSSLGRAKANVGGTIRRNVPADTKLYLTVTATPGVYQSLSQQLIGKVKGAAYPYRVHITGATPRTGDASTCNPGSEPGAPNLNYNTNGNRIDGATC